MKTISLFDLAPGKTLLDRYKVLRANRQGGMSTTFAVEDVSEGQMREIQVFPAALFEGAAQTAEFAQALSRWKGLRASHVLAVREVRSLEDGTILAVTDLPPGRTLREERKERPTLPPAEVVAIGRQLLEALAAIHASGLVHGDIKPHTIHVERASDGATSSTDGRAQRDGRAAGRPANAGSAAPLAVTLVDGGITPALWTAKHLGDRTALIGTPYYAPVEQFGGESPDVQSDLYNLATVLYELAAGVMPWRGKTFLEVFQSKLSKAAPPMRSLAPSHGVPADLEAAIAGGLRAEREERYASAAQFQARLAAVEP